MNPILAKAKDCDSCEVIAPSRSIGNYTSGSFARDVLSRALEIFTDSLVRLSNEHDLLIIEGAGSLSEINLNRFVVSNMQVERIAGQPVAARSYRQ